MYACASKALTKIAVIDSGINIESTTNVKLCDTGHYDFMLDGIESSGIDVIGNDVRNHGTNVAQIIANQATDYCLIILRVFGYVKEDKAAPHRISAAIRHAVDQKVDVINLSLEGYGKEQFSVDEFSSIWFASDRGIKIFVAAGNKNINLDKEINEYGMCYVYPACYRNIPNMTVVGSNNKKGNRGKIVTQKEPFCYGRFCGTSASAAYASGRYVRNLKR